MDAWFQSLLGNEIGIVVSIIVKIILILVPIILVVVPYLTYFERKVIGYMQLRVGPNVNGPYGLLQPYLDVVKLLVKEIIIPTKSNKMLLMVAPAMVLAPSLAIWVTLPMSREWVMTNLNAGLLYVLALSSVGVYGVILAGWASNSKYAFLGAMRSSAQMISYEIAMGFCLVAAVMVSGSLNFQDIVAAQAGGKMGGSVLSWNWLPLLPLFIVYLVCGVAETNRAPFDVAEGESEIVAGFHIEYSGFAFALFFLAEYINMIIFSALLSLLFLGGWLSPFPESWGFIGKGSALWMFLKMGAILFFYLWLRATFPRYRYDQIMRLGWKVFIPVTLVYLIIVMAWMKTPWNIWL